MSGTIVCSGPTSPTPSSAETAVWLVVIRATPLLFTGVGSVSHCPPEAFYLLLVESSLLVAAQLAVRCRTVAEAVVPAPQVHALISHIPTAATGSRACFPAATLRGAVSDA